MDANYYSPRLKEIMAELKAVLKKHDIAGYLVLHEPGFSECRILIEPSWSAMHLEKNAEGRVIGMRVRAKRQDYASAEAQRQAIESTLNLVAHLAELLELHAKLFAHLQAEIEERVEAEHTEGVRTPHREH